MKYGVDVAVTRADDLDKLMLQAVAVRVAQGDVPVVLDIGCGAGGQSIRLAKAGARVLALDILDFGDEFELHNKELENYELTSSINFVQADIKNWIKNTNERFDIVCCQRILHYLPYLEAKEFLQLLARQKNCTLYLSVTGMTSAIANTYPAFDTAIAERFAGIGEQAQTTFSISAPVCLYSESELVEILHMCGFKIIKSRVSDFGNIKVVARTF